MDLNADLGESFGRWTLGDDAALMPHLTSANVAAGFHGGDPHVLRRTVALAVEHGVGIGAHAGLPDLVGFGRRRMAISPDELDEGLRADLLEQLAAVERAEARLEAGTYGLSIESSEPIPDERLEARPTAELTAEEERARERG